MIDISLLPECSMSSILLGTSLREVTEALQL